MAKLRQNCCTCIRSRTAWLELKTALQEWLSALEAGSAELLRYVGLQDLRALYSSAFQEHGHQCTAGT